MAVPDDFPIALGFYPGHERAKQRAQRHPEQGDNGDAGCAEELAEKVVPLFYGRGEYKLVHARAEVAVGGGGHERGGHQEAEQGHDHVVLLYHQRGIFVDVAHPATYRDLLRAYGTEDEQGVHEKENPEHGRAEPVLPLKGDELEHRGAGIRSGNSIWQKIRLRGFLRRGQTRFRGVARHRRGFEAFRPPIWC